MGALVGMYIGVEAPLSGMSINPARTLASALPAHLWTVLWVYLTGAHAVRCAKPHHVPRDAASAAATGALPPDGPVCTPSKGRWDGERPAEPLHPVRSRFDGFPCLLNAKADAQVIAVEPALQHPNVRLLTRAYVTRLATSPSGRAVTTVHVDRDGASAEYVADIVVVACGAINSAALLLRSATDRHPRGLANRSDVVGRHYMRHNNSVLMAVSKTPNETVFQKTFSLNDFYFGTEEWHYPLGHIQMLVKSDAEMLRAEAPEWVFWRPVMPLDILAKHALDFWLTSEDLPDPGSRM